jgi:hypothetical protein
MLIKYYIKDVYGSSYKIILDNELAQHFYTLTHFKTLSPLHMNALSALGFTFEQVTRPDNTITE